jgi:Domain of unknown function (DUF4136)
MSIVPPWRENIEHASHIFIRYSLPAPKKAGFLVQYSPLPFAEYLTFPSYTAAPVLSLIGKEITTMRPVKRAFIPALASLLITGCASVAHVEKDKSVNLGAYHTYAWIDTKESKDSAKTTKVSDLAERNIHTAVNEELQKAGWRETRKNPDVLVSYDVLVENTTKTNGSPMYSSPFSRPFFNPYSRRWGYIYYPSQFYGYDDRPYSVREGTLTINMTDTRSDKTVWQGWTTSPVNSHNLTSKEIRNSVKNIFRKFDVAQR